MYMSFAVTLQILYRRSNHASPQKITPLLKGALQIPIAFTKTAFLSAFVMLVLKLTEMDIAFSHICRNACCKMIYVTQLHF